MKQLIYYGIAGGLTVTGALTCVASLGGGLLASILFTLLSCAIVATALGIIAGFLVHQSLSQQWRILAFVLGAVGTAIGLAAILFAPVYIDSVSRAHFSGNGHVLANIVIALLTGLFAELLIVSLFLVVRRLDSLLRRNSS